VTHARIPILVIVGPTAVGKTEASVRVAERLQGEIISADSRQIYRGMDIGTAKPDAGLLRHVPHHLIDVVDAADAFSAARFALLAREAIRAIHARARRSVVVGGSGLYIRALLDGLFPGPPASPPVRAKLQEIVRKLGSRELHARLSEVDPEAAGAIHPNDAVRLVRALEVFELTGDPITRLRETVLEEEPALEATLIGLTRDRQDLYDRIDRRVDRMMEEGLAEEVRRLEEAGSAGDRSWKAVGYREIASAIRGEISMADAVERTKRSTRRYAKRQITWFSRDPRITWVVLGRDSGPSEVAEEILSRTPDCMK